MIDLLSIQRIQPIQHIVREDLNNTAQVGDKVESLCGDETFRLRRKDDPNLLVCGMCALLMVREYRELLTDHIKLADLAEAMVTSMERLDQQAEVDSATEDDEDEGDGFDPDQYTPDVDDDTPTAPRGMEDVPLPGEGPGEQEEAGGDR